MAEDPGSAQLRQQLEAEYERQAQAIQFHIPAYADQPPSDGSLPSRANKKKKRSDK